MQSLCEPGFGNTSLGILRTKLQKKKEKKKSDVRQESAILKDQIGRTLCCYVYFLTKDIPC